MKEIEEIRDYCLNCVNKPCSKKGCPLSNDIPAFIHEKDTKKAFEKLCETTVLPAICGRVCPHSKQCQGSCVRGIKGEPVQIGKMEAYVGDISLKENFELPHVSNTDKAKKVAVIGSGPCGLTCAAFLAMNGIDVTIYEKYNKLGGLLIHGIPDFRLDGTIVDKTVEKILKLGIHTETNKELGKDFHVKDLLPQYDAVFISIGANISKETIKGENVIKGNEFLEKLNLVKENGENKELEEIKNKFKNKKIAISGGGNVAMDSARTFVRLGADVTVVYRRDEEQMPAEKYEIEDAKKEGVKFRTKTNILDYEYKSNKLKCIQTELIKREGDSRLSPQNIEGSDFEIEADYVVLAIGAGPEVNLLEKEGFELDKWNFIKINEKYETSIDKVFAGGDVTGEKATVAYAARAGRDAARQIITSITKI